MQSFISSVFSEMSNRVKTPLLGTFALCWLAYNYNHVAKLMFSDNTQRLVLIDSLSFDWFSDVLMPLVLALAYIFLVPIAQWGIDKGKYWLVDKRRTATLHHHLLDTYRSQQRVARQQSKTKIEYWQELHRNNAENAGQKIILLKTQISNEKMQSKAIEDELREAKRHNSNFENLNAQREAEKQSLISKIVEKDRELERKRNELDSIISAVKNSVNDLKLIDSSSLPYMVSSEEFKKHFNEEKDRLKKGEEFLSHTFQQQEVFFSFDKIWTSMESDLEDLEERLRKTDNLLTNASDSLLSLSQKIKPIRD